MKQFIILLMLLLTVFSPTLVMAQEVTLVEVETMTSTQSAEKQPTPNEDYALPYPGLLPDSPIYFLKVARDGVVGLLITNAAKKAEFNILQADKRLAAGKMLVDKKEKDKHELGISTMSKAENYIEEAFLKTQEARREGLETHQLEKTLQKSIRKHKEVVNELHRKASGEEKKSIETILKRVIAYEKKVNELIMQNEDK